MRARTIRNVPVKVQPLAESQDVDPDFNQAVGGVEYETDSDDNPVYVEVKGQPVFRNLEEAGQNQAGATRESIGYILMEEKEADKVKKFDKIVAINKEDLEAPVFIMQKKPNSFSGGSNLVEVHFIDRTDIDG